MRSINYLNILFSKMLNIQFILTICLFIEIESKQNLSVVKFSVNIILFL